MKDLRIITPLGIILFNLFDALNTYSIYAKGMLVELNPIMDCLINLIGGYFIIPKMILAVICAAVIFIYWNTYSLARLGGYIVFILYALLIIYQTVDIVLYYFF